MSDDELMDWLYSDLDEIIDAVEPQKEG